MSYKQLLNVYNESVVGREYQHSRDTLLLELALNDKTVKAVAAKYLEFEFTLNAKDPEQAKYLTNPFHLNNMLLDFCKERSILLDPRLIKVYGSDKERIKSQKFRTVVGKDLAYLAAEPKWGELKPLNQELAHYLLALEKLVPGI